MANRTASGVPNRGDPRSRLSDRLAIIDCREHETRLFTTYAALPVVKALPPCDRRWDAERRLWVIPLRCVGGLIRSLNAAGFEVDTFVGEVRQTYPATEYGQAA
jgi:hypothetical protein